MSAKHTAWVDLRLLEGDETGLGQVVIRRRKSGGQAEVGVFLVDPWCLGVRDAFFHTCEEEDLKDFLSRIFQGLYGERDASWARKFVEGAVSYAQKLGFAPHCDYKKAARVFGGIDVRDCEEDFQYGRDGEPFYFQGQFHDQATAEKIVAKLRAVRGDAFKYVLVQGVDDDSGEDECKEDDASGIECYAGEYALKAEQSGGGPLLPEFVEQVKRVEESMADQGLDDEVEYNGDLFDFADALEVAVIGLAESIRATIPDQDQDPQSIALEVAAQMLMAAIASFDLENEEQRINQMVGDPDVAEVITSMVADERVKAVIEDLLITEDELFRQVLFGGWDETQERFLVIYAELPPEEE